jgi:hypothetical protein
MSAIKHTTDTARMTRPRAALLIAALTLHAFASDACEPRPQAAELEASTADAELDALRARLDAALTSSAHEVSP